MDQVENLLEFLDWIGLDFSDFNQVVMLALTPIIFVCIIFKDYIIMNLRKRYNNYQVITYYKQQEVSPESLRQLELVKRKQLVLDMDETLIYAIITGFGRTEKPLSKVPHDFQFIIPHTLYKVYVYKRPHVDLFLDIVSQWFELIIFTAAKERYAKIILNKLDNGRELFAQCCYQQHCVDMNGRKAKYLSDIRKDLANIMILDNSVEACVFNPKNAIKIKSFRGNQKDIALLNMLPFLDALRFTKDVRSVLGRSTRFIDLIDQWLHN